MQDHVGEVVAIVEGARSFPPRPARLVWSGVYDAFGEIAWQRWPVLETRPPPLAVGARGLFVERLDAPPVMWSVTEGGYVGDERLAPGGDHLILARNRAYQPRWGRFLQPDPHGTGVAVQPGLGWGGDLAQGALDVPPPFASLESWTRDGVNVHAYCAGDPINRSDPTGLFLGALGGVAIRGAAMGMPDAGSMMQNVLAEMVGEYANRQSYDVAWAMEWRAGDDWHTRLDNTWVLAAIRRGMYNSFEVGIPFTDEGINPLDWVAGTHATAGKILPKSRFPKWVRDAYARYSGELHHIATAYGDIGLKLQVLFRSAGMELNDVLNALPLPGHRGPHSVEYHDAVYERLSRRLDGMSSLADRELALRSELISIRRDILNGSLPLNDR